MTPEVQTHKFQSYIVHGENWFAEVKEGEGDSKWSIEDRMIEAASRVIESFQGERLHPIKFTVEPGTKELILGPSVLVHRKQADPNKGKYFPTYIILANGGYHRDAVNLKKVWDTIVGEIMDTGDFGKPSEVTAHDVINHYRKRFPKNPPNGAGDKPTVS